MFAPTAENAQQEFAYIYETHFPWKCTIMLTRQEKNGHIISGNF